MCETILAKRGLGAKVTMKVMQKEIVKKINKLDTRIHGNH